MSSSAGNETTRRAARTLAARVRQGIAPLALVALAWAPACTGDNPLFVTPGSVTGELPDAHGDTLGGSPPTAFGTGGMPGAAGQGSVNGGGNVGGGGTASGTGGTPAGPIDPVPTPGPDADVSADTRPVADTSPGTGGAGGSGTTPTPAVDAGSPVMDSAAPAVDTGAPVIDTRPPAEVAPPPADAGAAADTAALMHGLSGAYYDGKNFEKQAFTRVDQIINFTWGNGSPGAPLPVDNFSVRWSGFIEPYETGVYTFHTESDDGIRVSIGGRPIISAWLDQTAGEHTGQATLTAGVRTPIEIEYYERAYTATARLSWQGPTTPLEIVPRSQLWTY